MTLSNLSKSTLVPTVSGEWFGRPTIEELSDGTWVMVYIEGTSHPSTDDVIHIRFSNDKGATWTAEDTDLAGDPVAGFPAYPTGAAPEDPRAPVEGDLYLCPNGDLLLQCWNGDYTSVDVDGTWQIRSTDGGVTWGAWGKVTFNGLTAGHNDYAFATDDYFVYNGVIYSLIRVYQDSHYHALVKSEDNGATWDYVSTMTTPAGTEEAGMEYLGNDTILAIIRARSNHPTWKMTSSDMGATWSAAEEIQHEIQDSGRHRIFTVAHLKDEANWWTDPNLVMCGFVFFAAGVSSPRVNTIWTSKDAGATWQTHYLQDGPVADAGYGDLIYDSVNDEFAFITYSGTTNDASIVEYRFTLSGFA